LAGTTYNDVLIVGMCPKMRPVGVMKKGKKDRNFHASNWQFAQTAHVDVTPEVIHFKFHENRFRSLEAVGGRKSPSPIDLAHGLYNSLYYRTSRDSETFTFAAQRGPRTRSCLDVIVEFDRTRKLHALNYSRILADLEVLHALFNTAFNCSLALSLSLSLCVSMHQAVAPTL